MGRFWGQWPPKSFKWRILTSPDFVEWTKKCENWSTFLVEVEFEGKSKSEQSERHAKNAYFTLLPRRLGHFIQFLLNFLFPYIGELIKYTVVFIRSIGSRFQGNDPSPFETYMACNTNLPCTPYPIGQRFYTTFVIDDLFFKLCCLSWTKWFFLLLNSIAVQIQLILWSDQTAKINQFTDDR